MSSEQSGTTPLIDPYLNRAYWDGRQLGDGTAEPWPINRLRPLDVFLAGGALAQYLSRGANTLALRSLGRGAVFEASNYPTGTILLTAAEYLASDSRQPARPMQAFDQNPLPERRPTSYDSPVELKGHGYVYETRPNLNVIVGLGKARRAYVATIDNLQETGWPLQALRQGFGRGADKFTVGETYNFADDEEETLVRINEVLVCMEGLQGRGRRTRALWQAFLRPKFNTS